MARRVTREFFMIALVANITLPTALSRAILRQAGQKFFSKLARETP
jgi:hypothetical protein